MRGKETRGEDRMGWDRMGWEEVRKLTFNRKHRRPISLLPSCAASLSNDITEKNKLIYVEAEDE